MSLDDINEIIEYIKEQTDFKGDIFININKNAIPIEFIEKRIKKALAFTHSKAEGNIIADRGFVTITSASFTAQVLANLLKAWEKENADTD